MSRQIFLQCNSNMKKGGCPGVVKVVQSYKNTHLQVNVYKCTFCKTQHGIWKIGRMKEDEQEAMRNKVNEGPIE